MPLGVRIIGNGGGNPPYTIDLVSTRSSPLHVTSISFNSTSLTVPALALAAGEQFVAMVSDQRGVGSLGAPPAPLGVWLLKCCFVYFFE